MVRILREGNGGWLLPRRGGALVFERKNTLAEPPGLGATRSGRMEKSRGHDLFQKKSNIKKSRGGESRTPNSSSYCSVIDIKWKHLSYPTKLINTKLYGLDHSDKDISLGIRTINFKKISNQAK